MKREPIPVPMGHPFHERRAQCTPVCKTRELALLASLPALLATRHIHGETRMIWRNHHARNSLGAPERNPGFGAL